MEKCHVPSLNLIYNSDSKKICKMWHKPKLLDSPGQTRHPIIATEKEEKAEKCEEEA